MQCWGQQKVKGWDGGVGGGDGVRAAGGGGERGGGRTGGQGLVSEGAWSPSLSICLSISPSSHPHSITSLKSLLRPGEGAGKNDNGCL